MARGMPRDWVAITPMAALVKVMPDTDVWRIPSSESKMVTSDSRLRCCAIDRR